MGVGKCENVEMRKLFENQTHRKFVYRTISDCQCLWYCLRHSSQYCSRAGSRRLWWGGL